MDKAYLLTVPSVHFKNVQDLLNNEFLNTKEKLVALYNWKSTCELEEASTAEGMCEKEGQDHPLADILEAIRTLKQQKTNPGYILSRRLYSRL